MSASMMLCVLLLLAVPIAAAEPAAEVAGAEFAGAEFAGAEFAGADVFDVGQSPALAGQVTVADRPVGEAKVYAYETGALAFQRVLTDAAGRFLFSTLPAGIYQIIVFKDGFRPVTQQLERRHERTIQRLDVELTATDEDDPRAAEDYWAVRRRIPPDVLRDMVGVGDTIIASDVETVELLIDGARSFETKLKADAGLASGADANATLARANVGFRGQVGAVRVGVEGRMQQLEAQAHVAHGQDLGRARAHALAVQVEAPADSQVRLLSSSGEIERPATREAADVDLEHHQLRWSGRAGDGARSGFSARYLQESNFYRPGGLDPTTIPSASRTLDLEGFYSREVHSGLSFEAGMRYREREDLTTSRSVDPGGGEETYGIYGQAGAQLMPKVMVEIGLYSRVRDGSLSLMPQGSFIIDLGNDWRASSSFIKRVDQDAPGDVLGRSGFTATAYDDDRACRDAGKACYEVMLSHGDEEDPSLTIGAVHREYAETLRVYFSDDFFSRLESLFLVEGDVLPELRLSVSRQITPRILARLESNFASGGGGIFYATDDRAYENEIRYLVTSIDTRFQRTATGVFVAFHHLEQNLAPVGPTATSSSSGAQVELERLQLMLTQDLDALMNISTNWAVRLNMEVSRGATPYRLTADDELYKTLTGGLSVSF